MKKGILKQTESILLLLIWIVILIMPLFLFQQSGDFQWSKIFNNWRSIFPFFVLFLINHFVLIPLLLFKNKKLSYIISAGMLIIMFSVGSHLAEINTKNNRGPERMFTDHPPHLDQMRPMRPPPHIKGQPQPNHFPYPPYVTSFLVGILLFGFDAGMRMNFRWSKLEQERTKLEKESVQNQLAFLRNQVSPHFFMNTLNNIHSLIDINTEEAKEAIIKLSKLMRHLLYDSNTDKIPLANELEFITSYTNLMKLRFSEKVLIDLKIPAIIPPKNIPPLLFTSFVENAFKHGISYQNESYIKISFLISNEELTFQIINSIPHNKKEDHQNGIGIENSRKRLDILYGKDYKLDIEEGENKYQLRLNIPL